MWWKILVFGLTVICGRLFSGTFVNWFTQSTTITNLILDSIYISLSFIYYSKHMFASFEKVSEITRSRHDFSFTSIYLTNTSTARLFTNFNVIDFIIDVLYKDLSYSWRPSTNNLLSKYLFLKWLSKMSCFGSTPLHHPLSKYLLADHDQYVNQIYILCTYV